MKNASAKARAIAIAITGVLASSAWAQTVYRCGDSYAEVPCAGGRPVQAKDPRTPAQQSQAEQFQRRDARLAEDMAQRRLREEAQADRQRARTKHASTPARTRDAAQDDWDDIDLAAPSEPPLFVAREPAKPRPARSAAQPRTPRPR